MIRSTHDFGFSDLMLEVIQVEDFVGHKSEDSNESLTSVISRVLDDSRRICSLKAEYTLFEDVGFNDAGKTITVNDVIFEVGDTVYAHLRDSECIAVFMATAGAEIALMSSREMKDGDILAGYIFDVVGTMAVERAAELMQTDLEKSIAFRGLKVTNILSPGYCGWNVAEQHKLFSLVPDNYCGIKLTDAALMEPVKSLSGLIGAGRNAGRHRYSCSLCDMENCIYRRTGR